MYCIWIIAPVPPINKTSLFTVWSLIDILLHIFESNKRGVSFYWTLSGPVGAVSFLTCPSALSLNGGNDFCTFAFLRPVLSLPEQLAFWYYLLGYYSHVNLLNPIAPGTRVERENIYWPDKPCVLIEFIIVINIFKIAWSFCPPALVLHGLETIFIVMLDLHPPL